MLGKDPMTQKQDLTWWQGNARLAYDFCILYQKMQPEPQLSEGQTSSISSPPASFPPLSYKKSFHVISKSSIVKPNENKLSIFIAAYCISLLSLRRGWKVRKMKDKVLARSRSPSCFPSSRGRRGKLQHHKRLKPSSPDSLMMLALSTVETNWNCWNLLLIFYNT